MLMTTAVLPVCLQPQPFGMFSAQEISVTFSLTESLLHRRCRWTSFFLFCTDENNFDFSETSLEVATCAWGVQVERVEVKDVRVPENLQRAMAAEAEAAREARAKVIAAEGEHKASKALRHAAEVIVDNPAALQVS